jgi:aromatic-L-amino-acid decarboxylase
MQPSDFRHLAHQTVDWMADYLRDVERWRIVPEVRPGAIRGALPADPPEQAEPFDRIRRDFEGVVVPGMTHWGHPGFFGYFPANTSPPSVLAEMIIATLGAQCMSWQTSPAGTELEQVVMEWLRRMLALPESFTGVIQDYASTSTLVSLITARDRARGDLDRAVVYLSAEAHSSVAKGARLAGFRPDLIRPVATDERYALRADALAAHVTADRAAGLVPAVVVATVGTTSSTAVDPVAAIGALAKREGMWFHVDAAFAGAAAIAPELRWVFDGIEHADSVVVNPHKWMLVGHDCSAYFVKDVPALLRSFGTSPDYLRTAYDALVVNYRDWGIPLGRRFRALKLWFVIRAYGVEGLRRMIREHVRLGGLFAGWVGAHPALELAAPAPLGLVCFRVRAVPGEDAGAADARTRQLLDRINAPGDFFLTSTVLGGRFTVRLALGHLSTTEDLIRRLWDRVARAATEGGLGRARLR